MCDHVRNSHDHSVLQSMIDITSRKYWVFEPFWNGGTYAEKIEKWTTLFSSFTSLVTYCKLLRSPQSTACVTNKTR